MRNKWKNAWKELGENRGSGVVLVLVAISCITLMAVSLLHMSYTVFKMKGAERQGKVDFYMAEAKVDELLTGVQEQVSEAIAEAQKKTLIEYWSAPVPVVVATPAPTAAPEVTPAPEATATPEPTVPAEPIPTSIPEVFDANMTETFQSTFLAELESWAKMPNSGLVERTDASGGTGIFDGVYDPQILKGLLLHEGETEQVLQNKGIAITGGGSFVKDTKAGAFILKDIQLSHTSAKSDYITNYEFDIIIRIPDFYYIQEGDTVISDPSPSAAPAVWKLDDLVTFKNWRTY